MPKDGWVQELEDAESAAKRSRLAGAQLRLAIAAYKLREFKKKLKVAANLGLALEGEKELLKEYVEKSKEQKEMRFDRNILEQQIRRPGRHCDTFRFSSSITPFTNLNILQYAVVTGDVTLMEEVVALGAALDFPVLRKNAPDIPPLPAPLSSTALLLACAMLAVSGDMVRRLQMTRNEITQLSESDLILKKDVADVQDAVDRVCECAVRLVHLGANCQVKL
jgi:hypothetical protein